MALNLRIGKLLGAASALVCMTFTAHAGDPWTGKQDMKVKTTKAKIKLNGKITKIPMYHVVQENCIFTDAEETPEKWTKANYKQAECVTLRNKRVKELSAGKNPPAGTKIFRVPANQYFKVRMEISDKMSNRVGEDFGFEIAKKNSKGKTEFIVGGWKVGETKTTKAIKLEPGLYYWRCPQNRTPWYGMIAE